MATKKSAGIKLTETTDMEKLLGNLSNIWTRSKALEKGLTAAGKVVITKAKQLAPRGNPNDKPELKPLHKTIGQVYRGYGGKQMTVIGPMYPAGAHGHLVEEGHRKVLWGNDTGERVPGKKFMAPAADQTQRAQETAITTAIVKEIKSEGG